MMNRYFVVGLSLGVLFFVDFFNRVYTPVPEEANDILEQSRDLVVNKQELKQLPASLESWINPPPPKKPEEPDKKGPTKEELEAQRIAQQRARMKKYGVELEDKVLVLRAVAMSSAKGRSKAIVEVYDVETAKMELVSVSAGDSLASSRVTTLEPLKLVVTTSTDELVEVPLFKF